MKTNLLESILEYIEEHPTKEMKKQAKLWNKMAAKTWAQIQKDIAKISEEKKQKIWEDCLKRSKL